MTDAEKILKKKAFLKAELDRQLPKAESDRLWRLAAERLAAIQKRYSGLPKGKRLHTDGFIFPAAAIYLTVKEAVGAEKAYRVIEDGAIANSTVMGQKIKKMMRLPGMSSLFLRVWDPLTKTMFGKSSGFQNVFYPRKKGEYRMDIVACPYHRYFTELGCPELTKIFCDNDERTYGDLPGIAFCRSTTLGKGGDHCDFYVKKV